MIKNIEKHKIRYYEFSIFKKFIIDFNYNLF